MAVNFTPSMATQIKGPKQPKWIATGVNIMPHKSPVVMEGECCHVSVGDPSYSSLSEFGVVSSVRSTHAVVDVRSLNRPLVMYPAALADINKMEDVLATWIHMLIGPNVVSLDGSQHFLN